MSTLDWWSRWVARSKRPIVVGPWRSETGFEILYWLPWLTQWLHRYQIRPERLIAISRGGASVWYPAGRHVELYDYLPPVDLRLAAWQDHAQEQSIKQLHRTAWEETFYRLLAQRLGLRRYHVLHPSVMYQGLSGWWGDRMGLAALMGQLRFVRPTVPAVPLETVLPERYVCVRFYERPTWPLHEETVGYCQQLVAAIAQHIPVVVVGSTAYADDHLEFPLGALANVTNLVDAFPLRENLALQSAVLAKASAFVGTYGGLMQLAVRLGIPSVGLYTHFRHTAYAHKMLTEWLGVQTGVSVFIGRPQDAEAVRQIVNVPLALPTVRTGSSS